MPSGQQVTIVVAMKLLLLLSTLGVFSCQGKPEVESSADSYKYLYGQFFKIVEGLASGWGEDGRFGFRGSKGYIQGLFNEITATKVQAGIGKSVINATTGEPERTPPASYTQGQQEAFKTLRRFFTAHKKTNFESSDDLSIGTVDNNEKFYSTYVSYKVWNSPGLPKNSMLRFKLSMQTSTIDNFNGLRIHSIDVVTLTGENV